MRFIFDVIVNIVAIFSLFFVCSCSDDGASENNQQDGDNDIEISDGNLDGDEDIPGESDKADAELESDNEPEAEKESEESEPAFDDPDLPGAYLVGAIHTTVTYEDPDVSGRVRELPCVIWYPTLQTGEKFYYDGWFPRPNVYEDVAPAISGGPYPLMAFSHGNSGIAEQSWTLVEYLVSHGFVVSSCNHVGNTGSDWSNETMPQSVHDRPNDVRAMIDHVLALNQQDGHRLQSLVDPERIGASGHSFGGYTTLTVCGGSLELEDFDIMCKEHPESMLCSSLDGVDLSPINQGQSEDPRVKAGVSFAPAGYMFFKGELGLSKISRPMMIMGADRDGTCTMVDEVTPIYHAIGSTDKALVTVKNAAHMSFSNMCELVGGINDYLKEEGCGDDFAAPQDIFDVMNHYTLAFMRRHLDNDQRYDVYLTADDPTNSNLGAEVEVP